MISKGEDVVVNREIMDEGKVFDACGLVEEIAKSSDLTAIQLKAQQAIQLLNQALEEGERVEENYCCVG